MTATSASTPIPEQNELPHDNLGHANRDCVGAHVLLHGRAGAAERFWLILKLEMTPHPVALPGAEAVGQIPAPGSDPDRGRRLY